MKVIRAAAMGFCFGVRDAIATAMELENPHEVTIHGHLVHNEEVLTDLARRGFAMSDETGQDDPPPPTRRVMITAHGISERERARLTAAGKELIDTTCPLVQRAHAAAHALEAQGYFVVVIGKRNHVEVRGIIGDLNHFAVVGRPDDVRDWPAERIGVICQTTTPPVAAQDVLDAIQARNPGKEIRFVSTICRPTLDRQAAARSLLRQVDALVVVGGRHSNNTRELAALAEAHQVPCLHVQTATDLDPAWLARFNIVGLTAGTSTPDWVIDEVYEKLRAIGGSQSTEELRPTA